MNRPLVLLPLVAACATLPQSPRALAIVGETELFAPGIVSTDFSEIRLTLSPDGRTALWFSRDRPGGLGGYDIWMSRLTLGGWSAATPVPFNSPQRDFDPAFSSDGRFVYFCSDRPGGQGRDDVYRVMVTTSGFGAPELLGPAVNSPGNEWAPMLSPDGARLLFSSDRSGGAGRQDLYVARRHAGGFAPAVPLPGAVNTSADEFDATYLSDSATIVFARAANLRADRIDLFHAAPRRGAYGAGTMLPESVNSAAGDTYGPMLDWSRAGGLTFSSQRAARRGMDLYRIRFRSAR